MVLRGPQRFERGGRQKNQELNCNVGEAQAMSGDHLRLEEMGKAFRQGDLGAGSCKMCRCHQVTRGGGEESSAQRELCAYTSVEGEITSR